MMLPRIAYAYPAIMMLGGSIHSYFRARQVYQVVKSNVDFEAYKEACFKVEAGEDGNITKHFAITSKYLPRLTVQLNKFIAIAKS